MSIAIQAPPLAQNVKDTRSTDAKKAEDAKKVGKDFEAILVRQMLSKANLGGKGGYGDMATEALASAVTAGGGLGLGRVIEAQLAPHHATTTATAAHAGPPDLRALAFKKASAAVSK